VVLRLGRFAASRGLDADALLAEHGLARQSLARGDVRVPYERLEALGARVGELIGTADLGLELGRSLVDPETLEDAGMLLLMASQDVRCALERAVRVQTYWGDGTRLSLAAVGGGLAVRYAYPTSPAPALRRHIDECALAEMIVALRHLTGVEIEPQAVAFVHARPADTSAHAALFRCPVQFGAAHVELVLDEASLALPMRGAHSVYGEIFGRLVERTMARHMRTHGPHVGERPLASQVRALVHGAVDGTGDLVGHVARSLRTSARTLQRRLRAEGTSLGAIAQEVRLEIAEERLAEGVPIKVVAAQLGFAEPSAFHRAFKRWTGRTPDAVRRDVSR
jgi:AraC-like DNA-binding protein